MPGTIEPAAVLPGPSPIHGKPIEACLDGAPMSSAGGLVALREVEWRLGIARRFAACIRDPRAPERLVHGRNPPAYEVSRSTGVRARTKDSANSIAIRHRHPLS